MRRHAILYGLTASTLIGVGVLAVGAVPYSDEDKVEAFLQPFPEKKGAAVVKSVSKDAIEIQFEKEPPRVFATSDALASGQVPRDPRFLPNRRQYRVHEVYMYRLTDVKVGDWVAIHYSRVNGIDVCDHIRIEKRPGGLVPPLPDGVETPPPPLPPDWPQHPWLRYHDWQNAHWDFEERGIPYPAKFGIVRYHTAPYPREVKK